MMRGWLTQETAGSANFPCKVLVGAQEAPAKLRLGTRPCNTPYIAQIHRPEWLKSLHVFPLVYFKLEKVSNLIGWGVDVLFSKVNSESGLLGLLALEQGEARVGRSEGSTRLVFWPQAG